MTRQTSKEKKQVSQSSSELNRIALAYLRRLRAEGLKSTKVEVLKPYDKRTDNAGSREYGTLSLNLNLDEHK
jgi:hypothetical protein